MQNPGPFIPSAASVPGAPPPGIVDQGVKNLGVTSLVLTLLMVLWSLFQLASAAASVAMVGYQQRMFASTPGMTPEADKMLSEMRRHMLEMTMWHGGRYLLYLGASGVLLVAAVKLMRGNPDALPFARNWTWGAFAVLGISVLIQAAIILPKQLAMQQEMLSSIPSSAGSPGFESTFQTFSMVWTMVMLVVSAVVLVIWPIVLRLWVDRIQERLGRG